MSKVNYGRIIQGILIAIISIIMGYFMEPLIAVLGLLIASSYVAVAIIQYVEREKTSEFQEQHKLQPEETTI